MPASLVEANSLLAIDIGAVNTRAAYFDVVEGKYRFIALAQSPTTSAAPLKNLVVGLQAAIQSLQTLIGKPLMDNDGRLITPSQPDGIGVDHFAATISAGPAIRTVVVGVLPEVSVRSTQALAQTTYSRIVETFTMNETRSPDEQVDAIIRCSPDLVLIAGGTDGGATQTVNKMVELIGLATYLMPETKRPAVLYAGNQALAADIQTSLKGIAPQVAVATNIRPLPDFEDLAPAQRELSRLVVGIRGRQMPEVEEIRILSGDMLLPSSYAQGRMVRFLASYFESDKGVMCVNLGAGAASMGISFDGDLHLNVFPQFGLGEPLAKLLRYTSLDELAQWVVADVSEETLRDYLMQKSLQPGYIPATSTELAIEQGLARRLLQLAAGASASRLPVSRRSRSGVLPPFEPIFASGAVITEAPTQGQKLLMLLDGLQPSGITTLALDQNNILSMLGAAAEINSLLPIQVINSGALSYLATVISPVSDASYGTPILKVKLTREDGTQTETQIKMGALQALPLDAGQTARLQLRPAGRTDVGLGPGRAGELDVIGSSLGVVIDARGRPLRLPQEPDKRRDLMKRWQATLGG